MSRLTPRGNGADYSPLRMENFLLIFDDIDDAIFALQMLWPRFAGFLLALGLFALTVLLLLQWPAWVLSVATLALLMRGIVGLHLLPGMRTDP